MDSLGKEKPKWLPSSPEAAKKIREKVPGLEKSKWTKEELKKLHGEHYEGEAWDKDQEQRMKAA